MFMWPFRPLDVPEPRRRATGSLLAGPGSRAVDPGTLALGRDSELPKPLTKENIMYVYVYMYICRYVYMYICRYVDMYMCICIYVYMYMYMYIHMYLFTYVCMYVCIYSLGLDHIGFVL